MSIACPSCTRDLPEDALYCAYCGRPLYGGELERLVATGGRVVEEALVRANRVARPVVARVVTVTEEVVDTVARKAEPLVRVTVEVAERVADAATAPRRRRRSVRVPVAGPSDEEEE